jgi:predicted nicotinamide N-methyase
MGNVNRTNPQLKSIDKTIIIEETKTLELNELVVFPHGYDGLHIWEAGIVLSRFVVFNPEKFKGK